MTRTEIAAAGAIALAQLAAEHGADNNFQAWEVADRIRGCGAMQVGRFATDIAWQASAAFGAPVTTGKVKRGPRWFGVPAEAQDRCDEITEAARRAASAELPGSTFRRHRA